jgi:hypothetical protein
VQLHTALLPWRQTSTSTSCIGFTWETSGFKILNLNRTEDGCLLGCCAVLSGRTLPTFHRCLLPPSSRWRVLNFYQTTRRNDPEDSHLHARRRENLNCHSEQNRFLSHLLPITIDLKYRPIQYFSEKNVMSVSYRAIPLSKFISCSRILSGRNV